MNSKRNIIFLLIFCSISGFGYISVCNGMPKLAAADIEWGISVGDKFTWVVSQSNESMGFLPKGSKFELTITSFENLTITPGEPISGVKANLLVYNSKTKLSTDVLTNNTFAVFYQDSNTTFFYAPFFDQGFFLPSNYADGFVKGYRNTLAGIFHFNAFSYGFVNNKYVILALNATTNLRCHWEFNENLVLEKLTIEYVPEENIQYLLVLDEDGGTTIPFGNCYLIFFGISLSAMTYLVYKKKFVGKKGKY
jgi:hypothetical protein